MSYLLAWVLAGGLGALVGVVEIAQRYRVEPLRAMTNRWGVGYLALNALLALAAFWVAWVSQLLAKCTDELLLVRWAAAAGLGSSVLLRTKLFDIRLSDGKEAALGPEIVVQTLLGVLDRELDRDRARSRFRAVHRLFTGIDFEKAKLRLTVQVFQALQTVTEEDTRKLMKGIKEVEGMQSLDSQDKAYLLGFYLLDLVGEEFLDSILKDYRAEFEFDRPAGGAPPPSAVATPPATALPPPA